MPQISGIFFTVISARQYWGKQLVLRQPRTRSASGTYSPGFRENPEKGNHTMDQRKETTTETTSPVLRCDCSQKELSGSRETLSCSQEALSCSREDLPWKGRGTDLDISGCRFSLYPMTDDFVGVILGALEKTDTSAVWSQSDALSTVYRGKLPYVADAVRGLFVNAWREGVHMALEGQFSKGCPGDSDGDTLLDREGPAPNLPTVRDRHFPVLCKLALYPMGVGDYIDQIAGVWRMAEAAGLEPASVHYATRIQGDVHAVFDYLEAVCSRMQESVPHYILHFTLSVNSPTREAQVPES